MTITYHVIYYRQYGGWYNTMPFKTRGAAESHADRFFRDNSIMKDGKVIVKNTNSHVTDITFKEVELPE